MNSYERHSRDLTRSAAPSVRAFVGMDVLRRTILVLALMFGALAVTQGPGQAAPLGASAQASNGVPSSLEQVRFVYYYGSGYRYRPYYHRRYFRARTFYYRPRHHHRFYYY